MRLILQELIKIKNRAVWSWYGFRHVAKTEGSLWQWIIANIISGSITFFLPISFTQQAMILAGGILILAAECFNTAIERVVDDISTEKRSAAKHAKDAGSAAVAITAIATGVIWLFIIFDLLSRH
jgi:diacylglycerol kinase (ATP)